MTSARNQPVSQVLFITPPCKYQNAHKRLEHAVVIFAVFAQNAHEELDDVSVHEEVDLLCIPTVSHVRKDIIHLILDLSLEPPQRLHEVVNALAVDDQVDLVSSSAQTHFSLGRGYDIRYHAARLTNDVDVPRRQQSAQRIQHTAR